MITNKQTYSMVDELIAACRRWRIWFIATIYKIVLSQRRTYLGTAWFFVGITLIVLVKAALFTGILSAPVDRIIPNMAIGMALWRLLSGIVNASCNAISANRGQFQQGYFPLFTPVFSTIVHHGFLLLHTMVPMVIISAIYVTPSAASLVVVPLAFVLIVLAATPIGFLLAMICARYRDFANLVGSALGVLFFLTPIIWVPEMAKGAHAWFLYLNPFFHFIELVRDPIVGQPIDMINWVVAVGILVFAWIASLVLYNAYGRRVLVWL